MTENAPKKKKRRRRLFPVLLIFLTAFLIFLIGRMPGNFLEEISDTAGRLIEPKEVRELRKREVVQQEEGHLEYYFHLLGDEEQRVYREILEGVRDRREEFYVTMAADDRVDLVYHAVLKDHPELFWIHNREQVYKTTFADRDYCLFTPGYTYSQEESDGILSAMEAAFQEVAASIPEGGDDYEKVKTVYTYLIDHVEYKSSPDDQSIAGAFWKHAAVCAGYAGAVQYLLERLGIPCIYVDGSARGSTEGHAWNIVTLGGEYYYVDVTNGDQPQFLLGDAARLPEHKTTMYDYLCPFPSEYELDYTPSDEFPVPDCTATDRNFYVLNQGCFDTYVRDQIYDYCQMRMNNGAAVVRFKFSTGEAFDAACQEWIDGGFIQEAARYYMSLYDMEEVQYHYGILENLKTIYFIF